MSLYQFPQLAEESLASRIKRLERTVQFRKRGINTDTGSKFRTVAASQVDRDGLIIVGGEAKKKSIIKSVATITPSQTTQPTQSAWPVVPSAPVIAIQLIGQPLVLTFTFNYQAGTASATVTEYRIYRNTTNDSTTAIQIRTYVQPSSGTGVQKVEDTVGANATYYYWVSAYGPTGESTLTAAQSGAVTSLSGTAGALTQYRPSTSSGNTSPVGFVFPSRVYDNNLSSSSYTTTGDLDYAECTWQGWSAAVGTPTSVVLKVNWMGYLNGGSTAIEYSINNGSTWNTITGTTSNQPTYITSSVTLLNTQNLTQVKVKGSASAGGCLYIAEAWIDVTT